MAHRYTISLSLFGILCVSLFIWNYSIKVVDYKQNEHVHYNLSKYSIQNSVAQNVFYTRLEKEEPRLKLSARSVTMKTIEEARTEVFTKETVKFQEARGLFFQKNQDDLYFQGDQVTLEKTDASSQYTVKMNDIVKITLPHSDILADTVFYNPNTHYLYAQGNVSSTHRNPKEGGWLKVQSQFAEAWLDRQEIHFRNQVRGQVEQKYSAGNEIRFQTKRLNMDIRAQRIKLKEGVSFQRGEIRASAQQGEIHLTDHNKKLKYYTLFDDVSIVTKFKKNGISKMRRAYGEKLESYTKDRKIILLGSPRLIQGENVINASQITFFEDTDTVAIDDPVARLKL